VIVERQAWPLSDVCLRPGEGTERLAEAAATSRKRGIVRLDYAGGEAANHLGKGVTGRPRRILDRPRTRNEPLEADRRVKGPRKESRSKKSEKEGWGETSLQTGEEGTSW